MDKKKVIIIGGGVAGLTAALELLRQSDEYMPIVIEEEKEVGGIARTLNYKGNRMDIGGHRFFSKDERVMKWWMELLPLQGSPSKDDIMLNNMGKKLEAGGPNPEKEEGVMLIRRRVSRILYLRKFFDYPISLKPQTFINMGFVRTMKSGFGYIKSQVHKRPENSLEDFMINRFGKALYELFFEDYTEKVWGRHPSQIDASWGEQRIKGLSLSKAVKSFFRSLVKKPTGDISQKDTETSLIEQFIYPKYGPGQLWQTVADEIERLGGKILCETKVTGILEDENHIKGVYISRKGQQGSKAHVTFDNDQTRDKDEDKGELLQGEIVISSMPIKDLLEGMTSPEPEAKVIAQGLPYRDFMTVGILADKLNLKNNTHLKTVGDIVPDTWIYVQERDVKLGRIQVFNNWSPYLVKDFKNKTWIGLEYFCNEGDMYWNMTDEEFIEFAKEEIIKLKIVNKEDIKDAVRFRIKKAYPAYFDTYKDFDKLRAYLDHFDNLYCIGRNGQHRYNNMDHSMVTAFETVDNILKGRKDKENIWAVNTEKSYHETKES